MPYLPMTSTDNQQEPSFFFFLGLTFYIRPPSDGSLHGQGIYLANAVVEELFAKLNAAPNSSTKSGFL